MWLFIAVFIIIIVGTIIGSRYSIKLFNENSKKKFLPFGIAFIIAVVSEVIYFFGAKHMKLSIDVSLSWMFFNMALFFAAGVIYFSAYLIRKD
ncbi:hypothetical protein [Heyndrickxia camelliae]|uniref:Uncharacterized protein n=1 Tax=Heyndrickxia camelliae TaxID=1707093 RepID=A0A2N3LPY1_9BACI|nr:hypothetical protein [Heyndrickxia camelliae]PKR86619.1 hypothetical protein CWO92_00715 [Heyndrickxia camelliae]